MRNVADQQCALRLSAPSHSWVRSCSRLRPLRWRRTPPGNSGCGKGNRSAVHEMSYGATGAQRLWKEI